LPAYVLMSGGLLWAVVSVIALALLLAGTTGVIHTSLVELFPPSVRTTAYSLGYNLGLAIFGGAGPLIVTSLIAQTKDINVPAYYIIFAAICSFLCALVLTESKTRSLLK